MEEKDTSLFYLGAGPLAAVLLGAALVPLRGFTTASNFTFAFLALTIVIAELAGRWAAVATALTSALSLDFFLTQPYMRLTIAEKHDIIAFLGLGVCGIIAAALGSQRGERAADLRVARGHLDLLHAVLRELERVGPLGSRLTAILDASRAAPLAAAVVRDTGERILAASPRGHGVAPGPGPVLEPDTLLARGKPGRALPGRGIPLPPEGARLALVVGNRQVGWLDVWGSEAPAGIRSRRALSDVARAVAVVLGHEQGDSPARD